MAKRKSKNKNQVAEVSNKQSFSYEGSVKMQIQRNGKTISTKTFKNSGRMPLFKFLCNCLAGVYSEQSRPVKLKLFNYTGTRQPQLFEWDSEEIWQELEVASPFVNYTSSPVVKEDAENGNYSATYHFKINDTYISGNRVNVIAIYGSNAVDQKLEACAYFVLKNEAGAWEPIDFSASRGNFSVIFEWTMKISNKSQTSN